MAEERVRALRALGFTKDKVLIDRLLKMSIDGSVRSQDVFYIFATLAGNRCVFLCVCLCTVSVREHVLFSLSPPLPPRLPVCDRFSLSKRACTRDSASDEFQRLSFGPCVSPCGHGMEQSWSCVKDG